MSSSRGLLGDEDVLAAGLDLGRKDLLRARVADDLDACRTFREALVAGLLLARCLAAHHMGARSGLKRVPAVFARLQRGAILGKLTKSVMPPRYAVWGEIASSRAKFLQPEGLGFLGAAKKTQRGGWGCDRSFQMKVMDLDSGMRGPEYRRWLGLCMPLPPSSSRLLHLQCGEFFHCQAGAPADRIFTGSDLELDFSRRLVRESRAALSS